MMNHRAESDSKKESTRKSCTEQEWEMLQSKLIPSLCAGMVGVAQLSPWSNSSFEITFSALPDRLQCQGI